jgi:hypothetical protein
MLVPDFAAVRYFFNYRFPHVFHRVIETGLSKCSGNVKGPYYRAFSGFNAKRGGDFRRAVFATPRLAHALRRRNKNARRAPEQTLMRPACSGSPRGKPLRLLIR